MYAPRPNIRLKKNAPDAPAIIARRPPNLSARGPLRKAEKPYTSVANEMISPTCAFEKPNASERSLFAKAKLYLAIYMEAYVQPRVTQFSARRRRNPGSWARSVEGFD